MKFLRPVVLTFLLCVTTIWLPAQEPVDTAVVSRLKKEGYDNSRVMHILNMLTDLNGPRLTNSPGYLRAATYAKTTMEGWGVGKVYFDHWDEVFGRGWELRKFSLQAVQPNVLPIIAYPKAWSPGVKGRVKAGVVYLDIKGEGDLEKYKGKLKGKIVLFSLPASSKPNFTPDASRLTDSALAEMAASPASEAFRGRRFQAPSEPQRLAFMKWELCQQEGALAVLEPSSRLESDGTLVVSGATVPYPAETPYARRKAAYHPDAPKILPQIVVSADHYNRMVRQVEGGLTLTLEMELETTFLPAAPGFNVIGEIPGTDLADEVVMIGAHLDSWHSATGTTDNAAGSAVMLETMRLIRSLGISPRRTIRIALWGGEEQGLLGSRSYVKRTYGVRLDQEYPYDSIQLTPAAGKFSVYFNMDNGSGKYRGVYLQGNAAAKPVFSSWAAPFEKDGSATMTLRNTAGTDHLSFDALGLPAFQFIQDPLEYGTRTHHTNMDFYDKAVADDLKHNAVMTAVFAWMAANREGLIPRKQ